MVEDLRMPTDAGTCPRSCSSRIAVTTTSGSISGCDSDAAGEAEFNSLEKVMAKVVVRDVENKKDRKKFIEKIDERVEGTRSADRSPAGPQYAAHCGLLWGTPRRQSRPG
jgi:hypothetical protein